MSDKKYKSDSKKSKTSHENEKKKSKPKNTSLQDSTTKDGKKRQERNKNQKIKKASLLPIYDILDAEVYPDTPLSKKKVENFLQFIDEQQPDCEVVYMIIYIYEHNHNDRYFIDKTKETIPYEGKQKKEGVEFDLLLLPCRLQWMLYKWMEMTQRIMMEECERDL